jgi:hypothetical protein
MRHINHQSHNSIQPYSHSNPIIITQPDSHSPLDPANNFHVKHYFSFKTECSRWTIIIIIKRSKVSFCGFDLRGGMVLILIVFL